MYYSPDKSKSILAGSTHSFLHSMQFNFDPARNSRHRTCVKALLASTCVLLVAMPAPAWAQTCAVTIGTVDASCTGTTSTNGGGGQDGDGGTPSADSSGSGGSTRSGGNGGAYAGNGGTGGIYQNSLSFFGGSGGGGGTYGGGGSTGSGTVGRLAGTGGGGGGGNPAIIASGDLAIATGTGVTGGGGADGGAGYAYGGGGGGGAAGVILGAGGSTFRNDGDIAGGAGGAGGSGYLAGGAGGGGMGIYIGTNNNAASNSSSIVGGAGGAGGGYDSSRFSSAKGSVGAGGGGGAGLSIGGSGNAFTNSGMITGGAGGLGGDGSSMTGSGSMGADGGAGGAGVSGSGFMLTNSGTVTGGAGGAGGLVGSATGTAGVDGMGGAGVVSTGESSVANGGLISGGLGADGMQADAVQFSGGGNTLSVLAGGSFVGNVTSAGGDTLVYGSDDAVWMLDASRITDTMPAAYDGTTSFVGFTTFDKQGAGTVTLTGTSDFTGQTMVDGGTLALDDADIHGSDVTVASGASLTGTGTIGALDASGSVLLPTTTNVLNTTDAHFASGSTLAIALDDGGFVAGANNGLVNASGTVTIDGGTVLVHPANGTDTGISYTPGTYTIVTAAGGVTGTFDSVSDDYALLDFSLGYDAKDVYLTSSLVDPCLVLSSSNQCHALSAAIASGSGDLFEQVLSLDSANLPGAAAQLTGEVYASAKTALVEDSHVVRDAVYARLADSFAQSDRAKTAAWLQGIGEWGRHYATAETAKFKHTTYGVLGGVEVEVTDGLRIGANGGFTYTKLTASTVNSSGHANTWHLGAYAGGKLGALRMSAGGAYARHKVSIDRTVTFGGIDDALASHFSGTTMQAFGEAAVHFGADGIGVEPFAQIAYIDLATDGFGESGGPTALSGRYESFTTGFSTLGARVAAHFAAATFNVQAGWQHALGATVPTSDLAFAAGNGYSVTGAPLAKDAATVSAGLGMHLGGNATVNVSYAGQFGDHVRHDGVTATLGIAF